MAPLQQASQRVAAAAQALDLDITIITFDVATRTAEEAAAACNTTLGQIVKSLVFRGETSGKPYLLLVSGSNRVNEAGVASTLGEKLVRPDARFVRDVTGYAIGGIPPFGHATPLQTYMDEALLRHAAVFAAAGTPQSIFSCDPKRLAATIGARIISVV